MARHGLWVGLALLLIMLCSSIAPGEAEQPFALESLLSHGTRLMIFAPHPDDESLGAGGLIQRILGAGGKVKVVFMTSGDGYPEGVETEEGISHPTWKDYRKYGKEREVEALCALAILGLEEQQVTFLGFPDGGLCTLLWKFRSDPQAYTSPFTMENHPPTPDIIIPRTDYNGNDLKEEIARVIADFHPTLIATTPPEDQHPDHCATYFFVQEALAMLHKKFPTMTPRVLTFLVHFEQWPVGQGSGTGSQLNPPEGFPSATNKWISFPLRPNEVETKRLSILQYHTQMLVMGRFLTSFARSNELFLMAGQGWSHEMGKTPCCRK
jgi:LmbE family N-acetylglucosaminyl deacetylase